MNNDNRKSIVWKGLLIIVILVMLFSTTASGLTVKAQTPDPGTPEVIPGPVVVPQIQTQPLYTGGPVTSNGQQNNSNSAPGQATPLGTAAAPEAATPLAAAAIGAHALDPRDMKVLVISPTNGQDQFSSPTDYRLKAIKQFLEQVGIPYDVYVANSIANGAVTHNPLPALWDGTSHGYYQGIILETGSNDWIPIGGGNFIHQLMTSDEWTALWNYESMFGVRELVMYVSPSVGAENYGLINISEGYISTSMPTTLTDTGKAVYPYINASNPVPFINTYNYTSGLDPASPATPLLVDPGGNPVVSTHVAADGHETMAITADYTGYLVSSLALSYGSLNWLTKGVFLGDRHAYLLPQVDDLLIDDNVWDTVKMQDVDGGPTYRMSGTDLIAIRDWQNGNFPVAANACVTLQPAGAVGKDTYIAADSQTSNYGNTANLYTRAPATRYPDRHTLLQFDLSTIPTNATVTSASVTLYQTASSGSASADNTVEIHKVTQTWTEGNGNAGSGATWQTYNGTTAWTTPGGDYDAAVSASFTANSIGAKSVNIMPLVQGWVTTPSANLGMILLSPKSTTGVNNLKTYASSETGSTNATRRPKLDVCYNYTKSSFMFEFPFNGEGASGLYNPDTLTPAVILNQANFRWVNHTYSHVNLDSISSTTTRTELRNNDSVAVNQLKLTNYSRAPFVQPDISGLTNRTFQNAAYNFGVRYLISDTSRPGQNNPSFNVGIDSTNDNGINVNLISGLLVIPRHPSNLFYNLVTPDQWVSEYNCYYGPTVYTQCPNTQWTRWTVNQTYAQILDHESDFMLQYLIKGDIDPLMFHQANLGLYDGQHSLITDLLDTTLNKYKALFNLPIRNMGQVDIGAKMAARKLYNNSGVKATLTPCSGISITTTSTSTVTIPLTGVSAGTSESYGGQNISYVGVGAGQTVTVPVTCP